MEVRAETEGSWGRRSRVSVSLALVFGLAGAVNAGHGGALQINRANAGPYAVSVWIQPSPLRAGPWQVDVAVMREGGVPVADAAVRLRAEPLGRAAQAVETDARREADPLGVRYRASLAMGAPGPWRITVSIAGTAGPGAGSFGEVARVEDYDEAMFERVLASTSAARSTSPSTRCARCAPAAA